MEPVKLGPGPDSLPSGAVNNTLSPARRMPEETRQTQHQTNVAEVTTMRARTDSTMRYANRHANRRSAGEAARRSGGVLGFSIFTGIMAIATLLAMNVATMA